MGTLLARVYIPYFDVVTPGATGGVSHWLNPEYIGDNHYQPNPLRPDSIILDNQWWKPIGPMYIATDEGEVHWPDVPPNQPGYPAPADPPETDLSLDVLPDAVRETAMAERLERELEIIDDLSRDYLMTTAISELEALMDDRLGPVGDQLDAVGSLDADAALESGGLTEGNGL